MRIIPAAALACAVSFPSVSPAQAPPKNPQRVAFVGEAAGPRTGAYAAFLAQRFAEVSTFDRDHADLDRVRKADVVLLDWGQSDEAREQRKQRWSPLGAREAWDRPTVLLGSAGLNLAGAWQVRGGFG